MTVFGIANHSPDFVLLYLVKKQKVPESDISFVAPNTKLSKKSKSKYFIFLSASALRRNLSKVNKIDAIGLVCAPPMKLNDFAGVIPLDFEESDSPHIEGFNLSKLKITAKKLRSIGQDVKHSPVDYALVVQEKVESFTGILTPFMTFVYTMPSSTHQKPVKELACNWLVGGGTVAQLESDFAKMTRGVHMTDKQKDRFLTLVTSEPALAYQKALQEAKKYSIDSIEFRNVADKHAVSAYEMRYMISVVNASA